MKKIVLLLMISISLFSCKKEFIDHNNISQDAAFSKPEAYQGIVLGMTKEFATNTLYRIVHAPALTTRELGNMNTYETESQLADGGPELTGVNSSISGMWRNLHRNRGIAEKILKNIDHLEFATQSDATAFEPERIAYKAYAKLFQAMTIGYMAAYWEKVTLKNDLDNHAEFVDRTAGYQKAIEHLDASLADLNGHQDAIDHINNLVSSDFSIIDVIYALKARYEIESGNYQEAYDAANMVDLTKKSVWTYDGGTMSNPVYKNTIKPGAKKRIRPVDSLGLMGTQIPELGDLRNDFYLNYKPLKGTTCSIKTDDPEGFWTADVAPIPVYLPDEMKLVKAEAKARMGGNANLAEAVSLVNEVRIQDPNADAFGVGGGLPSWTGDVTNQTEVLNEIYKNYAIELFLQGMRFPIHRRFYPTYLNAVSDWNTVNRCSLERLNNFYPYPDQERANNPNCPPDPGL